MPPINIINPWGKGIGPSGQSANALDAQRVDLWQLDLSGVVKVLEQSLNKMAQSSMPALGSSVYGHHTHTVSFMSANATHMTSILPSPSDAAYYVRSVELPELSIDAQPVFRDALPYMMPTLDKPPGTVNITFLVDSPAPNTPRGSKLLTLLYAWRALVRAGRGSFDGGFSVNESYEFAFGLQDAASNGSSLQPTYSFDTPLNLFRGDTPITNVGVLQGYYRTTAATPLSTSTPGVNIGLSVAGAAPIGLQYSTTFMLHNLWLSSFKLGSFKYAESGLAEISATFYCSSVVPIAPPS